eukprot:CAMPEP_0172382884 /NCGR_PEP_ID=MMETSP1061-20121228/855_1 /TAXON_ID=37318 /ORGANISM="Pseudo-nitzschia pungens, Strain cf. pungens" /LENGTH=416 /DNA_ID=CAMNT_0013110959 /DNA_START=252 /DNA_END=1502 /DNA_ORIENTATION=+
MLSSSLVSITALLLALALFATTYTEGHPILSVEHVEARNECKDDTTWKLKVGKKQRSCKWISKKKKRKRKKMCRQNKKGSDGIRTKDACSKTCEMCKDPINNPTNPPTRTPTRTPTRAPTKTPSRIPTVVPTNQTTKPPIPSPTPTASPTKTVSETPTTAPTSSTIPAPTTSPSSSPSSSPPPAGVCPSVAPPSASPCLPNQHGMDCIYEYNHFGCTENDIVCSPKEFYTCFADTQTWQVAMPDAPFCEEEPSPDLPLFEPCDPDECPRVAPTHGSSCLSLPPTSNARTLSCEYNYRELTCSVFGMICEPLDYFKCDDNDIWQHDASALSIACPNTVAVPEDFDSCEPEPPLTTKFCPNKEPEEGEDCARFYTSVTEGERSSSIGVGECIYDYVYYTCLEDGKTWKKTKVSHPPKI